MVKKTISRYCPFKWFLACLNQSRTKLRISNFLSCWPIINRDMLSIITFFAVQRIFRLPELGFFLLSCKIYQKLCDYLWSHDLTLPRGYPWVG